MALHYTRKTDDKDEKTVNAAEFFDRLCEVNKRRNVPEKVENTELTL